MKKIFIFLFYLPFLLSSCKDKDGEHSSGETIVKGHVLDKGSKAKVPDALVVLCEVTYEGLFGRSVEVLKTVKTDENGFYEIKVNPISGKAYECYAEKPSEYYPHNIERKELKEGTTNYMDHHLVAFAWFRVRLKNLQPFNHLDRISVSAPIENFGAWGDPDTTLVVKSAGNLANDFSVFVTKNGIKNQKNMSFFSSAFDTTDILIEY